MQIQHNLQLTTDNGLSYRGRSWIWTNDPLRVNDTGEKMQPTKIYKVLDKNIKKKDITFATGNQVKFLNCEIFELPLDNLVNCNYNFAIPHPP